jgi:hypothetical protein
MEHEGYLFSFDGWVAPPSKPVTLAFSSGVRFGLNYYTSRLSSDLQA